MGGEEERRAYVYLPTMYEADPDRRYPVLYMFDGQNVFFDEDATYGKSWGMADYLDYTDTPLIVAAVECNAATGYSLSVGGPILVPQSGTISLTPVAPHSLNVRPIVIRDDWEITLDVESRSHNFLVAVDGRSETCREGICLTVRRADYFVRIVKRCHHSFFNTLREKMMWGADSRL